MKLENLMSQDRMPDVKYYIKDPDYLRRLIHLIGIPQYKLADKLGIHRTTVRRYLSKTEGPRHPYSFQYAVEQLYLAGKETKHIIDVRIEGTDVKSVSRTVELINNHFGDVDGIFHK